MPQQPGSSDQLLLEEFFGSKFEPLFEPHHRPQLVQSTFFDGFVFWEITLNDDEKFLCFRANTTEFFPAFPILEVGVRYSSLRVDTLTGDIPLLMIVPSDTGEDMPPFWVTQGEDGQFSLSTRVGNTEIK